MAFFCEITQAHKKKTARKSPMTCTQPMGDGHEIKLTNERRTKRTKKIFLAYLQILTHLRTHILTQLLRKRNS
jgi:hypothetical protein